MSPEAPTTPVQTSSAQRRPEKGVCCFERSFDGQENKQPVRLVAFDFDETLAVATCMPEDEEFDSQIGWVKWGKYIAAQNFESPLVEGSRLEKLRSMLESLRLDSNGQERAIVVLTRNEKGAVACLNLLMMAGLAKYFSAIWSMVRRGKNKCRGVYRSGEEWKSFDPPLSAVYDHKADVLLNVCEMPEQWLPQLDEGTAEDLQHLRDIRMEEIVLVDDDEQNFQSPNDISNATILRYCKVARFDGEHPSMGFLTGMGGLGSCSVADYSTLLSFVNAPWNFKEAVSLECTETFFEGANLLPPATSVIFEFDETLSICTLFTEEGSFCTDIGCEGFDPVSRQQLVEVNFQSLYLTGSRLEELNNMLKLLATERTLAILTENSAGAVTVLNLLMLADLAQYFNVIWAPFAHKGLPQGVFRDGTTWKAFSPPVKTLQMHSGRASMINEIGENAREWFPQLLSENAMNFAGILDLDEDGKLKPGSIVAVDNERANFACVPRWARVARYDDIYRDMGLMIHMGGIGAKNQEDYQMLVDFVKEPWRSHVRDVGLESESFCTETFFLIDVSTGPSHEEGLSDDDSSDEQGGPKHHQVFAQSQ